MVSNVAPPTSMVRHSEVPQTEQHGLLPTLAPSHSSIGLPPIQIRFDSDGFALNVSLSTSLISRTGAMSNGRSASLSLSTARSICWCVALQRSQVLPSGLTSRCQRIGREVTTFSPKVPNGAADKPRKARKPQAFSPGISSSHSRRWLDGTCLCGGAGSSLISNSRRAASARVNGLTVPSGRFPSRAHYPGP